MNTKQMIALWYTGLASVLALLVYADSSTAYSSQSTFPILPVLACIVIVGGLLIATLRTSDRINQKRVLLYSLGPPTAIVALYLSAAGIAIYFQEDDEIGSTSNTDIRDDPSLSKIEVIEPCLTFEEAPLQNGKRAILTGRIRNQADEPVRSISVRVQLHKAKSSFPLDYSNGNCQGQPPSSPDSAGSPIDGHVFKIDVDVPSQATRSFTSETGIAAPRMRPSNPWEWSFEIKSASASNLYDL